MNISEMHGTVRAILFDKDGTLFDFRRTWLPIIRDAAKRFSGGDPDLGHRLLRAAGYDPDHDLFAPDGPIAAGTTADIARAWSDLLPGAASGVLQEEMDRFSVDQGASSSVPVCDLPALMRDLRSVGYRLGLATSDSEEGARRALRIFGIENEFCWISGYDSGFGQKPDPVLVEHFARVAGVATGSVAVVGDTFHDLRMGRAAGAALVVAVLTGAVAREVLEPEADLVLSSIEELPRLLRC